MLGRGWLPLMVGALGRAHGQAQLLKLSGACNYLNFLEDLTFEMRGSTLNGAPWYKAEKQDYYIYYDVSCGGKNDGTPRWIIDNNAPLMDRVKDLDGDQDCADHAHVDSGDGTRPPAASRWRMYCGGDWREQPLRLEEVRPGGPPQSTATTTTTGTQVAYQLQVDGACDYMNYLNGMVFEQKGFTASGAPFYRSQTAEYYIFFDPDCQGATEGFSRWVIDDDMPSLTKTEDLDNDGDCVYQARVDSKDVSGPPRSSKWRMQCSAVWVDHRLTLVEITTTSTSTSTSVTTVTGTTTSTEATSQTSTTTSSRTGTATTTGSSTLTSTATSTSSTSSSAPASTASPGTAGGSTPLNSTSMPLPGAATSSAPLNSTSTPSPSTGMTSAPLNPTPTLSPSTATPLAPLGSTAATTPSAASSTSPTPTLSPSTATTLAPSAAATTPSAASSTSPASTGSNAVPKTSTVSTSPPVARVTTTAAPAAAAPATTPSTSLPATAAPAAATPATTPTTTLHGAEEASSTMVTSTQDLPPVASETTTATQDLPSVAPETSTAMQAHAPGTNALVLEGGCAFMKHLNGLKFRGLGVTASGAPFYKATSEEYYIYYDPDCDGAGPGAEARWIIDNDAPSTGERSDLDRDGDCKYLARVNAASTAHPPSSATWTMYCGASFQDHLLTLQEEYAKLPDGTCADAGMSAITEAGRCSAAALGLGLPSAAPVRIATAGRPEGCAWDAAAAQLQLSLGRRNKGRGTAGPLQQLCAAAAAAGEHQAALSPAAGPRFPTAMALLVGFAAASAAVQ